MILNILVSAQRWAGSNWEDNRTRGKMVLVYVELRKSAPNSHAFEWAIPSPSPKRCSYFSQFFPKSLLREFALAKMHHIEILPLVLNPWAESFIWHTSDPVIYRSQWVVSGSVDTIPLIFSTCLLGRKTTTIFWEYRDLDLPEFILPVHRGQDLSCPGNSLAHK